LGTDQWQTLEKVAVAAELFPRGGPLLLSLMRLLWASLHGGPRVSRTHAESARQHDEILAALAEGDASAASARTYQHIMGADPVKELSG